MIRPRRRQKSDGKPEGREMKRLRGDLKAAAVRNAEQEKAINLLKGLADSKFKAAKKREAVERLKKMSDQLFS